MTTREDRKGARKSQGTTVMAMLLPLLLSVLAPASLIAPAAAQDAETGLAPQDIWSDEYSFQVFPWGGDSSSVQRISRLLHNETANAEPSRSELRDNDIPRWNERRYECPW